MAKLDRSPLSVVLDKYRKLLLEVYELSKGMASFFGKERRKVIKTRTLFNPKKFLIKHQAEITQQKGFLFSKVWLQYLTNKFLYWFSPAWFFFFWFRIIFSQTFWQLSLIRFKVSLQATRFGLRYFIVSHPLSQSTALGLLLVVGGFLQFIATRPQAKLIFFENAFPTLSVPTETLNWETFQYIIKNNPNSLSSQSKILWSDDSILVKTTISENFTPEKFLIGAIHDVEKSEKKIITSSPVEFQKLTGKNFYLHLDELPTKLDSLRLTQADQEDKTDFALLELPKRSQVEETREGSGGERERSFSHSYTINPKKIDIQKVPGLLVDGSETVFSVTDEPNMSYLLPRYHLDEVHALEKGIQQFFLQDGLIPFLNMDVPFSTEVSQEKEDDEKDFVSLARTQADIDQLTRFVEDFQNIYSTETKEVKTDIGKDSVTESEKIELEKEGLTELEKKALKEAFRSKLIGYISALDELLVLPQPFPSRQMSGYRYPDMSNQEVESFLKRNQFGSKRTHIRISLPPSFTASNVYRFESPARPTSTQIQAKKFLIIDSKTKEPLYCGHGLLIDKKDLFDWKIQSKPLETKSTQKEWLQRYLSFENPIMVFPGDLSVWLRSREIAHELAESGEFKFRTREDRKVFREKVKQLSSERNRSLNQVFRSAKTYLVDDLEAVVKQRYVDDEPTILEKYGDTLSDRNDKDKTPSWFKESVKDPSLGLRLIYKPEERTEENRPQPRRFHEIFTRVQSIPALSLKEWKNYFGLKKIQIIENPGPEIQIGPGQSPEIPESFLKKQKNNLLKVFEARKIKKATETDTEKDTEKDKPKSFKYIVEGDVPGEELDEEYFEPITKVEEKALLRLDENRPLLPMIDTQVNQHQHEVPELEFGLVNSVDYDFLSIVEALKTPQIDFLPSSLEKYGNQKTILQKLNFHIPQDRTIRLSTILEKLRQATVNLVNETNTSKASVHPLQGTKSLDIRLEPITNSWPLLFSSVGFGLILFGFVKSIMKDFAREIVEFVLNTAAELGFMSQEIQQLVRSIIGQREEKGYRILPKTNHKLAELAGLKYIMPEVADILWFFRDSGRTRMLQKKVPKALLLTGPPGTGKTLLVQALAGEARVPVIALSGGSLFEPGESPAIRLEYVFREARRLAPCIVFIDEMDSLAQKRAEMRSNFGAFDETVPSHDPSTVKLPPSSYVEMQQLSALFDDEEEEDEEKDKLKLDTTQIRIQADEKIRQADIREHGKVRLLLQFLVELDGMNHRQGILVIGATNRPETLDPAVLRPGRFDKIYELGLPNEEKRLDILKLYGNRVGFDSRISWDYLVRRTAGFSAADLASTMNESSLRAILQKTYHTIETVEHGIERITTLEIHKPASQKSLKQETARLAYYQAGKILLSKILENHPSVFVAHLWPRLQNIRGLHIENNVQKLFWKLARRSQIEDLIVGCYAGKAAEILFLDRRTSKMSTLGLDDVAFAQGILHFMVETRFLYSKAGSMKYDTELGEDMNSHELSLERIEYFKQVTEFWEDAPTWLYLNPESHLTMYCAQTYFSITWWQYQVAAVFSMHERIYANWFRIYLPILDERVLFNPEWIPADVFYNGNTRLKSISESSTWNDLFGIHRDYQIHSLVLQSFNRALVLLENHRELLDKLAYELIRKKILRYPDIEKTCLQFGVSPHEKVDLGRGKVNCSSQPATTVVAESWGINSRFQTSKWIDFESFTFESNQSLEQDPSKQIDPIELDPLPKPDGLDEKTGQTESFD